MIVYEQIDRFKMALKCPSYNRHFKIKRSCGGHIDIYLTQTARKFKNDVKILSPMINIDLTDMVKLDIDIIQNWVFKNGKLKREDINNMDKLLVDALFEKWGVDDSHLQELTLRKKHSTTLQYIDIIVYKTKELDAVSEEGEV